MGMTHPVSTGTTARARTVGAILAVAIGALALIWCVLVVGVLIDRANITYYLPPPMPGAPATEHHDIYAPLLGLIVLPAVGGYGALGGIVLGAMGLARRGGVAWWVLALPIGAFLFATIGVVVGASMDLPAY